MFVFRVNKCFKSIGNAVQFNKISCIFGKSGNMIKLSDLIAAAKIATIIGFFQLLVGFYFAWDKLIYASAGWLVAWLYVLVIYISEWDLKRRLKK